MQAALWVVLAATLGVAGLLRRQHLHVRQVRLEPPRVLDQMIVSAPAGWARQSQADAVVFVEPSPPGEPRRQVEARRAWTSSFLSPLEYLVRAGEMSAQEAQVLARAGSVSAVAPGAEALEGQEARTMAVQPATIAGFPGLMLSQSRLLRLAAARQPFRLKQLLACTVLPSGDVLTLRLEGQGIIDSADEDLVRHMAESLRLRQRPAGQGGRPVTFTATAMEESRAADTEGGPMIDAMPPQWVTLGLNDPLCRSRTFISRTSGAWLAVNLTPCIVLDDPAQQFQSMLLLRDLSFDPGPIRQIDEQVWTCQRQPAWPFPAVAYLYVEGGQGMLAEFRWDDLAGDASGVQAKIEDLWQEIRSHIRFPQNNPWPQRLREGTAAVSPPLRDPVELLPEGRPWMFNWQWYDERSPRTARAVQQYAAGPDHALKGLWMDQTPPPGAAGQQQSHWTLAGDSSYEYVCACGQGQGQVIQKSDVDFEQGVLWTTILLNSRQRIESRSDDLEAFVPGGLLPLALGRLPARALVLRTESLPGIAAAPGPLTLLLTPADGRPRGPGPWLIEVNGTGLLSCWELDEAGQVQAIGLPGRRHVHRLISPGTRPETLPASSEGEEHNTLP